MRVCLAVLIAVMAAGCSVFNGFTRPVNAEPIERGWMDRAVLERPEHRIFKTVYDTVHIQRPFLAMMQGLVTDVETIVFLGTWCPDSRREVPRFLKTVDSLGIPASRVKLYGVDRSKTSPDGLTASYDIHNVPTFIFLKEGKEIGRIVEVPRGSIEEDMFAILAKAAAM